LQVSGLIFPSRCRPFRAFISVLTRYIDIGFLDVRPSVCPPVPRNHVLLYPGGCAAHVIKVSTPDTGRHTTVPRV